MSAKKSPKKSKAKSAVARKPAAKPQKPAKKPSKAPAKPAPKKAVKPVAKPVKKAPAKVAAKIAAKTVAKKPAPKAGKPAKAPVKAAKAPAKKPAPKAPAPMAAPLTPAESATLESLASAKLAIEAALEKKALEPVLLDVCGRASYADFIGIVSGRSDRQVDAIADYVCEVMGQHGHRALNKEGMRTGRWVLLDFGDVVIHVFYHPLRENFDIESLWIDAPRVKLDIPDDARIGG